ncbi:Glycerophosphocholine phosphodiesterase [Aphanomyces cochlioides]|nr:Glycerophosphocholine phosphodiesterase [Aphanomyces cochlioides]
MATQLKPMRYGKPQAVDPEEVARRKVVNYALVEGAAKNDLFKVEEALKNSADIDCRYQGFTALYFACMKGYSKIVHYLLHHGARTDIVCNKQRTAIMIAASRGRTKAVELLLQYNANVHRKDERGVTARELALRNGHEDIASMLQIAEAANMPRTELLLHRLAKS